MMRKVAFLKWLVLMLTVFAALQSPLRHADSQNIFSGNEDYFVEAVVSDPSPFAGEQVIYSFLFYRAVSFQDSLSYSPPNFEGFWRTDMKENSTYSTQVSGRTYGVTQIDTAIYPSFDGELTIQPATLTLPATVFQDEEILNTQPVQIQVRPLPDGAPDGFDGAVGQFSMTATLDRQSLTLGEPFKLQVTVYGTGNIEQLTAPQLDLPENWRIYTNPPTYANAVQEGVLLGEKTFEWLLIPSEAGSIPLPQVTLWYFDPLELNYRSATTGSVNLEVLPSSDVPVAFDFSGPAVETLPLKLIDNSLSVGSGGLSGIFWILWVLPPAVFGLVWWWSRQQSSIQQRNQRRFTTKALERALRDLISASKAAPQEGYLLVKQIIYAYLGDRLDTDLSKLSQSELQMTLAAQGSPEPLAHELIVCLDMADSGIYAPQDDGDFKALIERSATILKALDPEWENS